MAALMPSSVDHGDQAAEPSAVPEAFWQWAERHRPYLKAIARRILGADLAGKVDASDVVQEGLLEAVKHWADFQGRDLTQWQGWVRSIIRSQALQIRRYWYQQRRNVARETPLAAGSSSGYQPSAGSSSPSQKAALLELTAELLEAIEQLPPDYQEVLRLRNFEDLSYAEVATRMKRREGAVRVLWSRAVQRLGEIMGDEA